jgi:AcrR family transcriptional regulator
VYHYFEEKQALVRAVIDYQTDAVLDAQSDHLDRPDSMAGLRAWRDFRSSTSAGSAWRRE